MHTDFKATFRLSGEAAFIFLSADVHQSWFVLDTSPSYHNISKVIRYQLSDKSDSVSIQRGPVQEQT